MHPLRLECSFPRRNVDCMRLGLRGWLLVLAGFGGVPCAAVTTVVDEDYTIKAWQTEDGLPQNSVTSIAQTPDGYLWLATFKGLARFDGVRFAVFDDHNTPALTSSRLVRLDLDAGGGLWITTEEGGLARLVDGQFTAFTGQEGLPSGGVSAVGQTAGGPVWLRDRQGGLSTLRDGRFVPVQEPGDFAAGPLGSFGFDAGGSLWLRHGRTLATYRDGRFQPLHNPDGTGEAVVRSVGPRARGGLVLITSLGLQRYVSGGWLPGALACPAEMRNLTSLFEDRRGQVWVGTYGNGLFRCSTAGEWRQFTVGHGLLHNAVRSLYEDREGNLWAGTDGGGLHRLKPRLIRGLETRDDPGSTVVMSLAEDLHGALWLGLNGRGVQRWEAGHPVPLAEPPQGGPGQYVYSILPDRNGAVWLGTYDRGLWRHRDGRFEPCQPADGALHGAILALLEDRSGALWVGTTTGLWRIREGLWERLPVDGEVQSRRVCALAQDSHGELYIGIDGRGVFRWQQERLTRFSERDGLADDHVSCLYVDREGGVWAGGSTGGLTRIRQGRLDRFSPRTGLPSARLSAILEDDQQTLWVGCERGIFSVSRAHLDEVAAGRRAVVTCRLYGRSEGLRGLECSGGVQPACWKARDGRLWFATVAGAAVVDPEDLPSNPVPPPVVIEEVVLDEQAVPRSAWSGAAPDRPGGERATATASTESGPLQGAGAPDPHRVQAATAPRPPGTLVIPSRIHRVEFRFTGLSLTAPERVRFRCRLEGYDESWIETGTQRTAHYTRVPPGRYRFQVTACNNDALWNETGAGLAVVVLPAWWQTSWARVFALLGLAAAVGLACEARHRRVRHEQVVQQAFARRLIESQEEERQRIAADLHDSLGQDLLVIKNRALLGLQEAAVTPGAAEQFGVISRTASRTLEEVHEISRDLRPYQLDRLGLTKALQAVVTSVSRSSGIPFALDLQPVDGLLATSLEIHLYRVLQELLNNIVKHSDAAGATVTVRHRHARIILTVQDDGRGFDQAGLRQPSAPLDGFGLTGVSERVRLLGGLARCSSRPGAGTRWTIEIPVPPAPAT